MGSRTVAIEKRLKPFESGIEGRFPWKMTCWIAPNDLKGAVTSGPT